MSLKNLRNVDRSVSEQRNEMSDEHRRVLRYMRNFLVANLDPDTVIMPLQNLGVLNVHGTEIIRSKESREDRCRTLLNMLPMRGPNSFQLFIQSLEMCGQSVIAETLKEQAQNPQALDSAGDDQMMDHSGRYDQPGDQCILETRERYNDVPFISAEQCDKILKFDILKSKGQGPAYTHLSIIINNVNYEKSSRLLNLIDNVHDCKAISNSLEESAIFQTFPILKDNPKDKLIADIKFFSQHMDLSDGLFCVIFSHASDDASVIFTCENESVNISKDIVKPLLQSEELSGKPKIFLFVFTVSSSSDKLPSFYNNIGEDSLFVILRNSKKTSADQRKSLISTFCKCIKLLGTEEQSQRELMKRLKAVAGKNVKIVNHLKNLT